MEPASRPAGSAGPAPAPPSRSLASDSPGLAVSRPSPASVPPAAAPAPRAQTRQLAPRALTQSSAPGVDRGGIVEGLSGGKESGAGGCTGEK